MQAEQLTEPVAFHGEGPVWSRRWGGLCWVDMLAGDILSLDGDGTVSRRHVGEVAAAVRPRAAGGAVIAIERGFALESADFQLERLPDVWHDATVRMNEGGCGPDGGFYAGSMAYDKRPGGAALYRLDPDGTTTVVLHGVTISNGIEWSPDGARAFYVDTDTYRVDVFDHDATRGLLNRRPFVDLRGERLRPDGLTVDVHGGVWVALANGGAVRRYDAVGRLDTVVEVPVRKVTACTIGGPALDTLFITTSRDGADVAAEPLAGSLFQTHVGAIGVPVREFAG